MTLELTIQDLFDRFPGLFKERSDCLNQLFCTIGNGYDWENGELVGGDISDEYIEVLKSHLVDGRAFQHNKLSLRAESVYYNTSNGKDPYAGCSEEERRMLENAYQKYLEKLPDDVYHKLPRNKRWSFWLSGYSTQFAYIFNYPDDIQSDWLDGIKECKQMLIEDGYDIDHPNENPIDTMSNLEEYRRLLREHPWF